MEVSFEEVLQDITKLGTKVTTDKYQKQGDYPIIDQGQKFIAGYLNGHEGLLEDIPVIIFGDHTRVLKYVDFPFFLGADGVKVLKVKNTNFLSKYVFYNLCATAIPDTGYNRHFKWLKQANLKAVPLETQQKIINSLDEITALIDKHKQQLEKLDLLMKSKFIEMFGGVNESNKFQYQPVNNFAKVLSGGTPDRKNTEYWQNGTIRWVKTTELQNGIIYDTEEKITEAGMNNSSAKKIPANSILIAMYGQGKTRGMTGYLAVECTTNQACACILPSKKVNQIYLWQFFILSYNKLREMAKGGNQPNLNAGIIKEFPILMPPIELQNEFASFVEQTDKTKSKIKQSLEKFDILKKALMQKYFG